MTAAQIILALVLLQRLLELRLARRNTERLLEQGAVEHGANHYPYLVLFHAIWLTTLVLTVPIGAAVNWYWLAVYLALQVARVWVIVSLGPFWTTRIITLPGAPLVTRGPFRYVRHPNYWVVAGEIAVLPLVFGEWLIAVIFSIAHAILIRERIATENAALAQRRRATLPEN